MFKENGVGTQAVDGGHVMADEEQRLCGYELAQESHAFLREKSVSHRQGLVHDKDVRIHMGDDGKGQAHDHAAGIVAHRLVDEVADIRKVHDGVVAGGDLVIAQPQDGGIQEDVLAPGEFGIEAAAQLQQGGHPSAGSHTACGGGQGPGDDLQERALARPVAPYDADTFASADGKVDMVQGFKTSVEGAPAPEQHLQQPVDGTIIDLEDLAHILQDDGCLFGRNVGRRAGGRQQLRIRGHRRTPFLS